MFAVLTPLPTALIKLQVQYTLVANNATGGYNVAYAGTIFAVSLGRGIAERLANVLSCWVQPISVRAEFKLMTLCS